MRRRRPKVSRVLLLLVVDVVVLISFAKNSCCKGPFTAASSEFTGAARRACGVSRVYIARDAGPDDNICRSDAYGTTADSGIREYVEHDRERNLCIQCDCEEGR